MQKLETLLSVKNLSVDFDGKKILRDINFEIKNITNPGITQGQVAAIIGKSGIGKSTLFNCLAGILKPTSGEILVNTTQEKTHLGEMGVVFQDYFIYPWRKVSTILEMAVKKNKKIDEKNRKDYIDQIVSEFSLKDNLDKYPQKLSGGQKQRVAIAEQILNGSNFLLLDEPFSGLDIIMLDKVFETLVKVSLMDEYKTILIVSHDLSNSVALSDTVYVVNKQNGLEGATIVKEIDLIERDLAWHSNVKDMPLFRETLKEIKNYML